MHPNFLFIIEQMGDSLLHRNEQTLRLNRQAYPTRYPSFMCRNCLLRPHHHHHRHICVKDSRWSHSDSVLV